MYRLGPIGFDNFECEPQAERKATNSLPEALKDPFFRILSAGKDDTPNACYTDIPKKDLSEAKKCPIGLLRVKCSRSLRADLGRTRICAFQ